jgi:hypothetical protein
MDRTRILRMALLSIQCNINPDLNIGMNIILPQVAMTGMFFMHLSPIRELHPILHSQLHIKTILSRV